MCARSWYLHKSSRLSFLSFPFSLGFAAVRRIIREPLGKKERVSLLSRSRKNFLLDTVSNLFFCFFFVRFYLFVFFPCHVVCTYARRGSLQSSLPSTPDKVYDVSLNRVKLGCVSIVDGRLNDDPLFESSGRKVSVNLWCGIVCSCVPTTESKTPNMLNIHVTLCLN